MLEEDEYPGIIKALIDDEIATLEGYTESTGGDYKPIPPAVDTALTERVAKLKRIKEWIDRCRY